MRRPASGKRPNYTFHQTALGRRLAGALPRPSPQGRAGVAEWLSSIRRTVAGKAIASLVEDHARLASLLGGIAETSPYLGTSYVPTRRGCFASSAAMRT